MTKTRPRRIISMTAAAVLAATGLVACGQEQSALCAQAEELRAAVRQLRNVSLSENGLGSFTTALDQVKTEAAEVKTAAGGQLQPQLTAVRTALDQVSAQFATARSDPSAAALGQVGVALGTLQTALADLGSAMADTCR